MHIIHKFSPPLSNADVTHNLKMARAAKGGLSCRWWLRLEGLVTGMAEAQKESHGQLSKVDRGLQQIYEQKLRAPKSV